MDARASEIEKPRELFEKLINDYPTCGKVWKAYIEFELKLRNFEKVEKLFQRSLIKVLNVDLWRCYLNYVRDVKSRMPNHKEKTAQAYDFALDKIGLDVLSYSIWNDYVNFLKSVEANGTFAESQKITAIRKVYQKGVMNPMLNVDQLWKDYCAFENQINPIIAKRMIDDRSREYMNVRKIAKEYENVTRLLDRNSPGLMPQGTPEELKQKFYWKKYIDWEKSNPLKAEDQAVVARRVMYAYEQWLLSMPNHPDVFYEAAGYLQQMSLVMAEKCDAPLSKHYANEANNIYERAITTSMKQNMLIYFAYCDFQESRLNYTKVKEIYDKLLDIKEIDPSLCYIQYMRFLRRVEGIRSARIVFKRARTDSRISYHVYVAAAFMEYFCTKDKSIAYKIFQSGMKMYGHITEYILAFIELAKYINDNDTMRDLFENVLSGGQLAKEKSEEIWFEWLQFENYIGDLDKMCYLEKRRLEFMEHYARTSMGTNQLEERQTHLLVDRFKFMDLYPCTKVELKSIGFKEITPSSSLTNTTGCGNAMSVAASVASSAAAGTSSGNVLSPRSATITSSPPPAAPQTPVNSGSQIDDAGGLSNGIMHKDKKNLTEKARSCNPFNNFELTRPHYPVPDVSKMYPFKPYRSGTITATLQPVPGCGLFLFPSTFADLIKRLPPPSCFNGPYVAVDEFLANFKNIVLPEDFQTFENSKNQRKSLESTLKSTKVNETEDPNSTKEANSASSSNSQLSISTSTISGGANSTKINESSRSTDIYKQRHQVKKQPPSFKKN